MIRRTALASTLVIIGTSALAVPANASDITFTTTIYRTDVAYAGFGGMRGLGTGDLSLTGVTGPVSKALLFWQGPAFGEGPVNAEVSFAGNDVTGTSLGLSSDNCWGFGNSQAYQADVTEFVSGNGTYALSNFIKPGGVDINGVSLAVFYRDADRTNDRDIVLFAGNDSNISNPYDAFGWNVTLAGINYSSGSATLDLHVADGQSFTDGALILNGATLAPAGPLFEGASVPRGGGGPANGGLWDIRSFSVTSFLAPGDNTLVMTSGAYSDCLSLVVAAVNLPAGAAPEQGAAQGFGLQVLVPGVDSGKLGFAEAESGESDDQSGAVLPTPAGTATSSVARGTAVAESDGFESLATGTGTAVDVDLLSGMVTADLVQATAYSKHDVYGVSQASSEGSRIADLRIAGQPVAQTGDDGQVIDIPGFGTLTLREKVVDVNASYASISVTMLHLRSTDGTIDIVVGSASASAGNFL